MNVFVVMAMGVGLSINYPIPVQFQYNRTVTIVEMTQKQINKQCGIPDNPKQIILACGDINGNTIYMPNPCLAKEVNDIHSYAHLACHEIAHTEGWVHD